MIDFKNVAGVILTDMGTLRINRGKIRGLTVNAELETPAFALQNMPYLKPEYMHNVVINMESGGEVRFSSRNLSGGITHGDCRFKIDISPEPFAVCSIPLGMIKITRVILWESRRRQCDPPSTSRTQSPLGGDKPWPQDPLAPSGS
jgi:hypothetical protein